MFVKILLATLFLASLFLSGCGTSYEERVRNAGIKSDKSQTASAITKSSQKSKTLLGAVSSGGSEPKKGDVSEDKADKVDSEVESSQELDLVKKSEAKPEPKKAEVAKIKDSSEDLVATARQKASEVTDVVKEEADAKQSLGAKGEEARVAAKADDSNAAASIMKRTARVKELANSKKADYIKNLDEEFAKFDKELELAKEKALKIVTDAKAKVSKDMEVFNSSLAETEKSLASASSLDAKGIEQLNNSLDRIVGELKESLGVE